MRLRRHTDNRIAIYSHPRDNADWCVVSDGDTTYWADNDYVHEDGWSELFVAELPKPDHNYEADDGVVGQWETSSLDDVGTITAWNEGVETSNGFYDAGVGEIERMELDALKLLAAIATHRRYKAGKQK